MAIDAAFDNLMREFTIIADLSTPKRKSGIGKGCPWWNLWVNVTAGAIAPLPLPRLYPPGYAVPVRPLQLTHYILKVTISHMIFTTGPPSGGYVARFFLKRRQFPHEI
jgi:hypothetical protein